MLVFSLSIKAAMETLSAPLPDDLVLVGVVLKSAPKIVRIEPFLFFSFLFFSFFFHANNLHGIVGNIVSDSDARLI